MLWVIHTLFYILQNPLPSLNRWSNSLVVQKCQLSHVPLQEPERVGAVGQAVLVVAGLGLHLMQGAHRGLWGRWRWHWSWFCLFYSITAALQPWPGEENVLSGDEALGLMVSYLRPGSAARSHASLPGLSQLQLFAAGFLHNFFFNPPVVFHLPAPSPEPVCCPHFSPLALTTPSLWPSLLLFSPLVVCILSPLAVI